MWREVYGRGINSVDIEPIGDVPFHADVAFTLLPDVGIAAGSRSAAHYKVTRELAGRGRDIIGISILRSGSATSTQYGKELIDGVGSASILMSDDPSTSTMLSEGSFTTLALSRPAMTALLPNLSAAAGRCIRNDDAALCLLRRYVEMVQEAPAFEDRQIAQSVSTHILDLAALALGARGDVAELARLRGARAARFQAIKADILGRLGSRDLSTDDIAVRHGISSRYVRKLFEEEGSSFSCFILSERLSRAWRMLGDRRCAHLNIARIAHESGFGDISYFNRVFRRHFGATPSDVREAARLTWRD